ncbi:MAG: peptidoglycan DD-metalloendopeptidase family protein [Balneolaceae bacterium]
MIFRIASISILVVVFHAEMSVGQSGFEERRTVLKEQQEVTKGQIESLEEQIETYQNRLDLASSRYDEMYQQYEELTRLIALQDERIRRMEQEQQQIRQEMELVGENIVNLEADLNELIERYQSTLIYLYKHGRTTEIALVLTSSSINQLLVRSYYLSRFNEYREDQEEQIRNKQEQFEYARLDLENTSRRNEQSLHRIQEEKQQLAEREDQQKRNIELLQRDRNQLQDQLSEVEKQRLQLDETLTALIEEEAEIHRAEEERQRRLAEAREIEDERAREEAVARYSQPVARAAVVSNEELEAFETSFADARGRLPWPVDEGTVTEQFGERVHPVFGTRTNNPGVDIATGSRSQVRTIHDGYVAAVQPFTGFGDVVMVNHGRYITVYGNLSSVFVSRGQVLGRGDVIGLSGDEYSIRGEVLFFMIRDGSDNVNPESWIQQPSP